MTTKFEAQPDQPSPEVDTLDSLKREIPALLAEARTRSLNQIPKNLPKRDELLQLFNGGSLEELQQLRDRLKNSR